VQGKAERAVRESARLCPHTGGGWKKIVLRRSRGSSVMKTILKYQGGAEIVKRGPVYTIVAVGLLKCEIERQISLGCHVSFRGSPLGGLTSHVIIPLNIASALYAIHERTLVLYFTHHGRVSITLNF